MRLTSFCSQETESPALVNDKSKQRQIDCSSKTVYRCSQCDFKTIRRHNLKRHSLTHGMQSVERDVLKNSCAECGKPFSTEQKLLYHVKLKHTLSQEQYSCFQCAYKTKVKRDFSRHLDTHLPQSERQTFPCKHCEKRFLCYSRFKSHVKEKHDKVFK